MMTELTGQARLFALPMPLTIVVTARSIEMHSIYEARLTDEEVAERTRAREAGATGTRGETQSRQ